MLKFDDPPPSEISIDMTPMIDCVFQLLIFFLLSSSFLTPSVRLQLPKASPERSAPVDSVIVTLDASGQLFVNHERIAPAMLRDHLRRSQAHTGKQAVILRADRAQPYEKVLEVLVAIQQAGGRQLHLAYEENADRR